MQNKINIYSPNFSGLIFPGGRKIKGMYFCKYGDQEMITQLNQMFKTTPEKIRLSIEDKSLVINVDNITPENIKPLNPLKRFFYRIDKKQNKLLEKIKNGTFTSFFYKLDEKEYNSIKRKPFLFFNKKELGKFEENIKTYIQPNDFPNLKRIFY